MALWIEVSSEEIAELETDMLLASQALERTLEQLRLALAAVIAMRAGAGPELGALMGLEVQLRAAVAAAEVAWVEAEAQRFGLREAVRSYDGAESGASFAVRAVEMAGPLAGPLLLGQVGATIGFSLATGEPQFPGGLVGGLSRFIGLDLVGWAGSRVSSVLGPDPVGDVGAVVSTVGRVTGSLPAVILGRQIEERGNEVTMQQPVPGPSPAAGSIADLATRIDAAYEASGPGDSAVDVQRIEHADGTLSWTVAVPGTMSGLSYLGTSSVPMSVDSNVPAFLGIRTPASSLVIEAMEQAGIQPGEPVVLAGHSQGGMVVTDLANDPAFTEHFTVAALVTFGSPIAHMPATTVPTLHVQHAQDGLPAISGGVGSRPGGPAPDEVVVVRELTGPPVPGGVHAITTYATTAQLVVDQAHPGMIGFDEATAQLWAGEGDSVTSSIHRGSS